MSDLELTKKALSTTAEELRAANDLKGCILLGHLRRNIERLQSQRANARHQALAVTSTLRAAPQEDK